MPKTNKTVPSAAVQLAELRVKLAGHKVFGKCRRSFDKVPVDELLKEETPTATLEKFVKWTSHRKIMLGLLAQYKRDGWTVAYEELLATLIGNHTITGEELPLEATTKGVLVMLSPARTLLMTRLLYTSRREAIEQWIKDGTNGSDDRNHNPFTGLAMREFPGIPNTVSWEKVRNHPFSPTGLLGLSDTHIKLKLAFPYKCWYLSLDESYTDLWYESCAVACFITGVTQDDVLGMFTRREKENVATWQFDFPQTLESDFHMVRIGLHPESESSRWKTTRPSFVSKGSSQGLSAILLEPHTIEGRRIPGSEVDPELAYESLHIRDRRLKDQGFDPLEARLVLKLFQND